MLNQVNSPSRQTYTSFASKKKRSLAEKAGTVAILASIPAMGWFAHNKNQQAIESSKTAISLKAVIADMQRTGADFSGIHLRPEEKDGPMIAYYDKDGWLIGTTLDEGANGKAAMKVIQTMQNDSANPKSVTTTYDGRRNTELNYEAKNGQKYILNTKTGEKREDNR